MAYLKKIRSKYFIYSTYYENGKRSYVAHATQTSDREEALRMLQEFNDGGPKDSLKTKTIEAHFATFLKYKSETSSAQTIKTYREVLRTAITYAGISDHIVSAVKKADLLRAIYRADIRPVTQANILRHLKVFWNYLLEIEAVTEDHLSKVKVKRVKISLPDKMSGSGEIDALLAAGRDIGVKRPYLYMAILLAHRTGMRRRELVMLKCSDVSGDYINVFESKSASPRTIPISDDTREQVRNYIESRSLQTDDFLLSSSKRKRLSPTTLSVSFRIAARQAGIPESRTLHGLRHGRITRWVSDGLSPFEAKELAGHESITTTQIYTHIRPASLHKKVREIEGRE